MVVLTARPTGGCKSMPLLSKQSVQRLRAPGSCIHRDPRTRPLGVGPPVRAAVRAQGATSRRHVSGGPHSPSNPPALRTPHPSSSTHHPLRSPHHPSTKRAARAGAGSADLASVDEARIRKLVGRLGAAVARDPDGARNEEEEAKLWRELGTLYLDGGEYAEAHRIYRRGAARCPGIAPLRFIARVYGAFHDDDGPPPPSTDQVPAEPPPAALEPAEEDAFAIFSLDVDAAEVPASILQFAASTPEWEEYGPPTRLVHLSDDPVLPPAACRYLVGAASRAVQRRGGWTTDRHIDAPTCDIPVFELEPAARAWVRHAMQATLLPFVAYAFQPEVAITAEMLRVQDCFVVRYDGQGSGPGFAALNPHRDKSIVSLTIALNDREQYEGGGLRIHATGDVINGDAGTVICFAGGLVHEGAPVMRGTRWIMTVFLYVDENVRSGLEAGYTLHQIENADVTEEQREQPIDALGSWMSRVKWPSFKDKS